MTYQDVFVFNNTAQQWLIDHKEDSKFAYALRKVLKGCERTITTYRELVEDANIAHCLADEKGKILKDAQGGYEFDKAGANARNTAVRPLVYADVVVVPFMAADVPALAAQERAAFEGFVIPVVDGLIIEKDAQ